MRTDIRIDGSDLRHIEGCTCRRNFDKPHVRMGFNEAGVDVFSFEVNHVSVCRRFHPLSQTHDFSVVKNQSAIFNRGTVNRVQHAVD